MKILSLCLVICCVLSCSSNNDSVKSLPPVVVQARLNEFSPEEREIRVPNKLFEAVYSNDLKTVEQIVKTEAYLLQTHEVIDGNTPLGLALELYQEDMALMMLERMALKADLFHLNSRGESYVFLASKSGLGTFIQKIADRLWLVESNFRPYNFDRIDQQNLKGQRALHVAAHRGIAALLQEQYYRGVLNIPYWTFSLERDKDQRNFIHQAAIDGRIDVIQWAVDEICHSPNPADLQDTHGSIGTEVVNALGHFTKIVQTNFGGFGLDFDILFNWQDKDLNTPLHLAVQSQNFDAVRVISSCQYTDYFLKNSEGFIPLHFHLQSVDQNRPQSTAMERDIFQFLVERTTNLRFFYDGFPRGDVGRSAYVNTVNRAGERPLHTAAKIRDPYYYNTLSTIGDINLPDANGQTASQIFSRTTR